MKNQKQKKSTLAWWLIIIIGGLVLAAVVFALPASPAVANPPAQDGYPVETETPTPTNTLTLSPTFTATLTGTLPPPVRTGTPTQLVPVTGADLTQPPPGSNVGVWVALWLLGLLLVGFGASARLRKR